MEIFKISKEFLKNYENSQVKWANPLSEFVYYRTYSHYIEEEDRYETWIETIKRIVEATFTIQKKHCQNLRLVWKDQKAQKSAHKMFDKMFNFKFLPAGRGIWGMGSKYFNERQDSTLLNNCAFITTDDILFRNSFAFMWTMNMLMLGVGVGFDTLGAKRNLIIKKPIENLNRVFEIEDSREGWVSSIGHLIDAFFLGKELYQFDYTKIRKKGERIKGFGGIASGYEPLEILHNRIKDLLYKKIGQSLSSVDIFDIMCFIANCVISGNVRRSALICLAEPEDTTLINAKNYNLEENKEAINWRWSANISIKCNQKTNFKNIIEESNYFERGEPGFVFLENAKKYGRIKDGITDTDSNVMGVNPCGEQFLENAELCNLVEVFPSNHSSYEEFEETLKYAFLYAKTVTLVPTLTPETNAVMLKNRRVGVSLSGIIDFFKKVGRKEALKWFDNGYNYLRKVDDIYSDWLCIPRSKKLTTVKPSGTVSLLAGVSAGIHYPYASTYIRRVRVAKDAFYLDAFRKAGYEVEDDKYDNSTAIISFIIKNESIKTQKEVSIWEQIKNAVDMQYYWSDNAVSITAYFKKEERNDLVDVLECFSEGLKGVTFLPFDDNKYEQAPIEEISEETYKEKIKNLKPISFEEIFSKKTEKIMQEGDLYCSNDSCNITKPIISKI